MGNSGDGSTWMSIRMEIIIAAWNKTITPSEIINEQFESIGGDFEVGGTLSALL